MNTVKFRQQYFSGDPNWPAGLLQILDCQSQGKSIEFAITLINEFAKIKNSSDIKNIEQINNNLLLLYRSHTNIENIESLSLSIWNQGDYIYKAMSNIYVSYFFYINNNISNYKKYFSDAFAILGYDDDFRNNFDNLFVKYLS